MKKPDIMITDEIRTFVDKVKLAFIATVCPDGTPNLSPKGSTIAWDPEHLAFADIRSPETVTNLLNNPAIEVNVVDIFTRKGYRFKGTAKILSDGPIFEQIIRHYRNRGTTAPIHHVVLVKVDKIRDIVSPVYDAGKEEEEVRQMWAQYWAG